MLIISLFLSVWWVFIEQKSTLVLQLINFLLAVFWLNRDLWPNTQKTIRDLYKNRISYQFHFDFKLRCLPSFYPLKSWEKIFYGFFVLNWLRIILSTFHSFLAASNCKWRVRQYDSQQRLLHKILVSIFCFSFFFFVDLDYTNIFFLYVYRFCPYVKA